MHENARHRMQKVYTVIDTAEDQAAAEFNHAIAEAKAETGEFSVSDATIYTKKHLAVLDVFSIAVAESIARTGEFTQEQLKQFAKLKAPKNPQEAYQLIGLASGGHGYLAAAANRVSMWWSGNRRPSALTADADSGAGLQGGIDDDVPRSDGDASLAPSEGCTTSDRY